MYCWLIFYIVKIVVDFSVSNVVCKEHVIPNTQFVPLKPSESYTHYDYADDDNREVFKVFWKILRNDEIQFEIHCKTTGWVGFGISSNGGMKNSDILIGWYDHHGPQIRDCYAKDESTPLVDELQNWQLLDGGEVDGYTILKVKRNLYPCDEYDKEIKVGVTYALFAWNDNDPKCNDWKYHGINRYTKALLLLNYKNMNITEEEKLPPKTSTYDIRMRNIEIPAQKSYYYCDIFELPNKTADLWLIKYDMLINRENSYNVHYVLGYECDDGYVPSSSVKGDECNNLPKDVKRRCKSKVFATWSFGSRHNHSFIMDAGYPLIRKTQIKYVMLEVFYSNYYLEKGKIDNSGFRLYLTQTKRTNEIGILQLTSDNSPLSLQIPGRSNEFRYSVICYPQCTDKFLPKDGIFLFSGLLHTHLAGRSVKLSLIRNGKLINRLIQNRNYDSQYQHLIDIEPVKLKKNDALILECEYNTEDRDNFTLNGFSRTSEETCSAFLYYYPRIPDFDFCMSPFSNESLFEFYEDLMKKSLMPAMILEEDDETFNTIEKVLHKTPTSPKIEYEFKEFFASHYPKIAQCGTPSQPNRTYVHELPHYSPTEDITEELICDYITYPYHKTCSASRLLNSINYAIMPMLILITSKIY